MTSVQKFRLEADRKLNKAAETRKILRTSLALASEQVASLTSQLQSLGPPSEDLVRTLDQVRSELLTATKAASTESEKVVVQAQRLAAYLQRLWPWMKRRHDELLEVHHSAMKSTEDREQAVLAALLTTRNRIAVGLAVVILAIGVTALMQSNKISNVQQASAMCRAGERLVTVLPTFAPIYQDWIKANILVEPAQR